MSEAAVLSAGCEDCHAGSSLPTVVYTDLIHEQILHEPRQTAGLDDHCGRREQRRNTEELEPKTSVHDRPLIHRGGGTDLVEVRRLETVEEVIERPLLHRSTSSAKNEHFALQDRPKRS